MNTSRWSTRTPTSPSTRTSASVPRRRRASPRTGRPRRWRRALRDLGHQVEPDAPERSLLGVGVPATPVDLDDLRDGGRRVHHQSCGVTHLRPEAAGGVGGRGQVEVHAVEVADRVERVRRRRRERVDGGRVRVVDGRLHEPTAGTSKHSTLAIARLTGARPMEVVSGCCRTRPHGVPGQGRGEGRADGRGRRGARLVARRTLVIRGGVGAALRPVGVDGRRRGRSPFRPRGSPARRASSTRPRGLRALGATPPEVLLVPRRSRKRILTLGRSILDRRAATPAEGGARGQDGGTVPPISLVGGSRSSRIWVLRSPNRPDEGATPSAPLPGPSGSTQPPR